MGWSLTTFSTILRDLFPAALVVRLVLTILFVPPVCDDEPSSALDEESTSVTVWAIFSCVGSLADRRLEAERRLETFLKVG